MLIAQDAARPILELVHRQYTGGLELNASRKLVRVTKDQSPQYVGQPSEELDHAWEDLMSGKFASPSILLSDTSKSKKPFYTDQKQNLLQIKQLKTVMAGDSSTLEKSMVKFMLTSSGWTSTIPFIVWIWSEKLCISTITFLTILRLISLQITLVGLQLLVFGFPLLTNSDHCLDYIRQGIQCQADLTPLLFKWDEPTGNVLPEFGITHTCRNWDKIHAWAKERKADHWIWVCIEEPPSCLYVVTTM